MKNYFYFFLIVLIVQSCSKESTSSEQLIALKKYEGNYADILPCCSEGKMTLFVFVKDEKTIQLNFKGDSVHYIISNKNVFGQFDLKFDAHVEPFPGQTSAFVANLPETNYTINKIGGGTISGKINGAYKLIWPQIIADAFLIQDPAISSIGYNKK